MSDRRRFIGSIGLGLAGLGTGRLTAQEAGRYLIDAQTGHRLRVLAKGSASGLYFHQNPFTASGDKMVYRAPTPDGPQSFMIDWISGTSEQLTYEAGGINSEIVGAQSRTLYYRAGRAIKSLTLDTRNQRHICDLPRDLTSYPYALSCDECTLASGYIEGGEEFAKMPRAEIFVKMFDAKLRNVIYTIEIATGAYTEVYAENTWLGHFQFSPTDSNTLMFCHEGPWEQVDRIWLLNLSTRETRLAFTRRREGEIAGHEFWNPSGEYIWFDLRNRATGEFYLANVSLASGQVTAYPLHPEEWSVHYNIDHSGRLLCGDGGEQGPWIYLYEPQTDGTVRVEKLCSMEGHDYRRWEPNAHFTPDGEWVTFTTNVTGSTDVRAVSVRAAPT
ncbi:MAG: oligogalacturonate lyase family protein [Candidatus Zipacnadales bacterium]